MPSLPKAIKPTSKHIQKPKFNPSPWTTAQVVSALRTIGGLHKGDAVSTYIEEGDPRFTEGAWLRTTVVVERIIKGGVIIGRVDYRRSGLSVYRVTVPLRHIDIVYKKGSSRKQVLFLEKQRGSTNPHFITGKEFDAKYLAQKRKPWWKFWS